ncbi:hypothetical protein BN3590_01141 [Clostridium sp. C105KSO15]|nr:hypothetical protein BN3590_01141 [Clostridium sp. C105KSO15]
MRLFHVSEENNIGMFEPRIPERNDLDKSVGFVWAIDEQHLANFMTPRNCPRITYHVGEKTSVKDKRFFLHHQILSMLLLSKVNGLKL